MATHKDRFFNLFTPRPDTAVESRGREVVALQWRAALDEVWTRKVAPAVNATVASMNKAFDGSARRIEVVHDAAAMDGVRRTAIVVEVPGHDIELDLSMSDSGDVRLAYAGGAHADIACTAYDGFNGRWLETSLTAAVESDSRASRQ